MSNYLVRAAVAAAIAGSASMSVNAATYNIHVSGASAQRTFWESDLEAITNGTFGSAVGCTLTKTGAKLNPAIPDLHALSCVVQSTHGTLPTGVNVSDTINLFYEAEFGSVWGIAPFLQANLGGSGNAASVAFGRGRMELKPAGAVTCNPPGYSRDLDTESPANTCLQGPVAVDVGVTDMEPVFWANPDNWPVSDGISGVDGTGPNNVINVLSIPSQGAPTLAQLQDLQANHAWKEVNGQVFSVVTDNSAAPSNTVTNLSTQSLRAIFTGQYTTWSQVPEVGSADTGPTNIIVCRRDHGSGTQVAASQYFTQTECGGNPGTNGSGTSSGGPTRFVSTQNSPLGSNIQNLDQTNAALDGVAGNPNPVENYSSNDIKTCLGSYPGKTIGLLSLSLSNLQLPIGSTVTATPAYFGNQYNTISIDNVQPNAHNAAFGAYKFAFTTWVHDNTPTTQGGIPALISARLITDAQKISAGVLPQETGTLAGGVWTNSDGKPAVAYAVEDGLNGAPTFANNTASPGRPVAVWTNSNKSSCTIAIN